MPTSGEETIATQRRAAWIDRYFEISSRGSSLSVEVLAGVSTFLALSYIVFVNPAILAEAGIDRNAAFLATVLISGCATIVMGLVARLPFALAPGMEMNAFVATYVVGVLGYDWREALGAVFWSGLAFMLVSASGMRERVIQAVPTGMRTLLSLVVGVFILIIGLSFTGVVTLNDGAARPGVVSWPQVAVLAGALIVILILEAAKWRIGVLVSVVLSALMLHVLGGAPAPAPMPQWSDLGRTLGQLDLGVIADPRIWGVVLTLFLVDFYGSVAKLLGIAEGTGLLSAGRLPRIRHALLIDSTATTLGAVAGTSNLTVYVESAVGIAAGGRTGVTALICGIALLGCLALAPIVALAPAAAASGALVFVALKLAPSWGQVISMDWWERATLVGTLGVLVITFSVDRAFLAAAIGYVVRDIINKKRPNVFLVGSIALLLVGMFASLHAR